MRLATFVDPQNGRDARFGIVRGENIVDVVVFLTNMKDDFPTYNRLYAEYFAGPPGTGKPNPTRTTLEINCLPTPIAIELKVIATM